MMLKKEEGGQACENITNREAWEVSFTSAAEVSELEK